MNANVILDWLKANVFIVIFVVIMIASLIALPLIASGISGNVRAEMEQRARRFNELNQIERAQIPVPRPDGTVENETGVVNERLIERIQHAIEIAQEDSEAVLESIIEHNQKNHDVLMENVFPEPPRELREVIPRRFYERVHEAYENLMDEVEAGTPPSPAILENDVRRRQVQFLTQMFARDSVEELDESEREELRDQLRTTRLLRYQETAERILFYASVDQLRRPSWPESGLPSIEEMFEWQWRYWIQSDLLHALRSANEPHETVLYGPVKRLVDVWIDAPPSGGDASGRRGELPLDYGRTFTGRVSNHMYDVRYVEIDLIVDSERIPEVIDALSTHNLATVTDLTIRPADPYEEARAGYFYGDAPISFVTIQLETLWLREWIVPHMPESVRERLGIEGEPGAA